MDLDSCSGSDHIRHWAISCHSEANSLPVDGSSYGLVCFLRCAWVHCALLHPWVAALSTTVFDRHFECPSI